MVMRKSGTKSGSIQVTFRVPEKDLNAFLALAEQRRIKHTVFLREMMRNELNKKICPRCGRMNPAGVRFCCCCSYPFTEEAKKGLEEIIDENAGRKLRAFMSQGRFFEGVSDDELNSYEEVLRRERMRRGM